jgi:hypothetical protein
MTLRIAPKRSSSIASRFFWRIAKGGEVFLQELANLREDGTARFKQKYEETFNHHTEAELLNFRDELRALWTDGKVMPARLAAIWNEKTAAATGTPLDEFICNRWLRASRGGLVIMMGEIQPDIGAPLALLAYCAHLYVKKMRVCGNRDCPAPYFVAVRRDQRFCSSVCAAPSKLAAKVRSWHKHKDKWVSQKKRAKHAKAKNSQRHKLVGGPNDDL